MQIYKAIDIGKKFEDRKLFEYLSLDINKKETIGIYSSDTEVLLTLFESFTFLDDVDSGEILIKDKTVNKLSDTVKTKYKGGEIGVISLNYLLEDLNIQEILKLNLLNLKLNKSEIAERIDRILKFVELENINQTIINMSEFDKTKLCIALGIVHSPSCVFIYDLFKGFEGKNLIKINEIIKKISSEKGIATVIMSSELSKIKASKILKLKNYRLSR